VCKHTCRRTPSPSIPPAESRASRYTSAAAMCGIVGVYGHPEAANITYFGVHSLQHRGDEAKASALARPLAPLPAATHL
jgi:hypothetical protein